MTVEVLKKDWEKFFAEISRELFQWQASVEAVNHKFGRQTVVNKLAFVGITSGFATPAQSSIELTFGDAPNSQTHIIRNPLKVSYLQSEKLPGRLIAIEDENGNKTFINLHKSFTKQSKTGDHWTVSQLLSQK
jgi:hypothetical protein